MNTQATNEIHLTIDGTPITVSKGTTVYAAAKKLGIEIPIFCYHDRMPPFGACRMCLVEVEKMGKLQTSCTLQATEGMVVKTQSHLACEGRKEIIEFLLINHPLDCPICDRGGECPLQDNALKHGPGQSRFYEEKRHFSKALALGPVLTLDRERCIVCARCTRFSDLISGDQALQFIERGYQTEVGTPNGQPIDSKFIGNTIMICPVGALTSQVYRFRARPWDNHSVESSCSLCPVGCSLILDSRDGEIVRTRSLENPKINDIWLCDKGWFGYEFSSHPKRLTRPLIRRGDKLEESGWDEALSLIAERIATAKPDGKLAAIGGNPLTTEENFFLQQLMREGAEVNHVDHRVGMPIFSLDEEGLPPGMSLEMDACETLDFAFLWGLDVTEEFPILWLRLKQAINRGAKVVFLGHYSPEIASQLENVILHPPGHEQETLRKYLNQAEILETAGKTGEHFIGRQYLASPERRLLLSNFAKKRVNILEGRGNSLGARFAGMHPELGPLGKKLDKPGLHTIQILENASAIGWDFLYVVGADPAKKLNRSLWEKARHKLGFLVVQDLFLTATAQEADVVLPSLSALEKEGCLINIEHRIQRLRPGKAIPEGVYSDGEIFQKLAQKLSLSLKMPPHFSNVLKQDVRLTPISYSVKNREETSPENFHEGLMASFSTSLFDQGERMKHNPHLLQLAKTPAIRLHPLEAKKRNIGDKSQVKVSSRHGDFTCKAQWDGRVALNTVMIPLGFENLRAQELDIYLMNGLHVEVQPC